MLKAKIDNLDGLTDDEKKHYIEKDGKFILDVGPVDGMSLENVIGLKKTVETLRAAETKLKQEVSTLTKSFEGIDAEDARTALAKMGEIKSWDKDTKVKEAIAANKADLVKQHDAAMAEVKAKLVVMTEQLHEAVVTSKIIEALNKEGGNIALLLPHVKKTVRMKEGADGNFFPEVVGDDGVTPRVGNTAGDPMSILQRIQEMKTQDTFAPAFAGTGSSGSGSTNNSKGWTSNAVSGGVLETAPGHFQVDNLEDVASGKTQLRRGQASP